MGEGTPSVVDSFLLTATWPAGEALPPTTMLLHDVTDECDIMTSHESDLIMTTMKQGNTSFQAKLHGIEANFTHCNPPL